MQINFLKKHEQEMIDYVKAQNPKVTSVQFDWNSVDVGVIGNGTPQGGGEALSISGRFNDVSESSWTIMMPVRKTGALDIKGMGMEQPLRIVKNGVDEIYE
jgi:hypothetical protein